MLAVMDQRIKIPGLALLSLSLTECVEREPGADADPIVGEWHAVLIDGQKYPLAHSEDSYMQESGFDLRVEADLQGVLVFATDFNYEGYVSSSEQGSTVVVDASEAPKYRIDVTHVPIRDIGDDGRPSEPTDSYNPTITGYDDTGNTGDYGDAGGEPTSGMPYDPYGGLELPDTARPLRIPLAPTAAPAEMVLRCTLDADVLNCKRDGSEKPLTWVFERDAEPVPAP